MDKGLKEERREEKMATIFDMSKPVITFLTSHFVILREVQNFSARKSVGAKNLSSGLVRFSHGYEFEKTDCFVACAQNDL
jgi:hypothetical protein